MLGAVFTRSTQTDGGASSSAGAGTFAGFGASGFGGSGRDRDGSPAHAAPPAPLRPARRNLCVTPASGRASQRDDLAKAPTFAYGACATQHDLVVRTDSRVAGAGPVGTAIEREVDTGRRSCHA